MRIKELYIREFGALKERRITLRDGMNIIEGANEAGKSTVMLFIRFMLYGLPRRGDVERDRSVSRDGHRADGVMRLEHEGQEYRIERSYVGASRGSEKLSVYRVSDGERVFDGEEPGAVFLKVPKEVFEGSCSIGQMQCSSLGGDKGQTAIRNILSSADESVDIKKITKRLEDIRVRYQHKTGRGGKIYDISERLNSERLRLERATENHARVCELREKVERNSALVRECEEGLRRSEDLLLQINKVEVLRRFDAMRANEAEMERVSAEAERLSHDGFHSGRIPTDMEISQLEIRAENLERAETSLSDAQSRAQSVREELPYNAEAAELGESLEREGGAQPVIRSLRAMRAARRGTLIGALACAVCAAILLALDVSGIFAAGIVSAIMAFAVAVSVFSVNMALGARIRKLLCKYGKRAYELEEYLLLCESSLKDKRAHEATALALSSEVSLLETRRNEAREALGSAMRGVGSELAPDAQSAKAEAARMRELLQKYRALRQREATLEAMVRSDGEILSVHDESELRASLDIDPASLGEKEIKDANLRRAMYAEKLRTLSIADKSLREELINRTATCEDPLVIADRCEALRGQLAEAEEYLGALMLAIEGISAASEAMSGNITPAISRNAGKMMEHISGGRYSELLMNHSMKLSLVDGGELTTESDMLSGGTRDAAYISLRIALMMQIFGAELPPMFLDEALCQLDDTRAKRILALLGKLCENTLQCLLFTCHGREASVSEELGIAFERIEL